MPSVLIRAAQEKIDVLTGEVLFPAFSDLLAAKGLRTDLDLVLGRTQIAAQAAFPLSLMIKYESDTAPSTAPTEPLTAWDYFARAAASRPVDDDTFELPRYTRS